MSKFMEIPGYTSALSLYETQTAIGRLKRGFEDRLSRALNLSRVSAPLFVEPHTGLNDDLSGVERAVEFDVPDAGCTAQVVHSLAKWKRMALWKYEFPMDTGLYTDMNAIRREEELDNLHSVYVDQWDWEKVIDRPHRTEAMLKQVVRQIVDAICDTQEMIQAFYPALNGTLEREVYFVTTQELEDLYPDQTGKERENCFLREHKTAFIMQIGDKLRSGKPHDARAPDYDDWTLNGDIMFWDEVLGCAIELSSMGIRVDEAALNRQLDAAGAHARRAFPFHQMLLEGKLPLTMGGGIGQSRLCMLLLEKMHVGEVQVSVWDDKTLEAARRAGIELL